MEILSISVTLFLIMDGFGNIPIFLPILDKVPANRRRRVLVRELLIALAVIVGTVLCGRYVMEFLGRAAIWINILGSSNCIDSETRFNPDNGAPQSVEVIGCTRQKVNEKQGGRVRV